MQRIHLAMLRVSSKLDSKDESPDDRYIGIEDMDSFVDADGLLTATSIRMSLAIMECLAPSSKLCPNYFISTLTCDPNRPCTLCCNVKFYHGPVAEVIQPGVGIY